MLFSSVCCSDVSSNSHRSLTFQSDTINFVLCEHGFSRTRKRNKRYNSPKHFRCSKMVDRFCATENVVTKRTADTRSNWIRVLLTHTKSLVFSQEYTDVDNQPPTLALIHHKHIRLVKLALWKWRGWT